MGGAVTIMRLCSQMETYKSSHSLQGGNHGKKQGEPHSARAQGN